MCFYFLTLGHILGDFTFQTDRIARNKQADFKWILVHSFIVMICMLLFSIPFGINISMLVILSCALHYVIDLYKSRITTKSNLKLLVYFLIDQTIHITIIFIISMFSEKAPVIDMAYNMSLFFLFLLAFTVSFGGILVQYILKIFFPYYNRFFNGSEKIVGQIIRLLFFIILYFSFQCSMLYLLTFPLAIFTETIYYIKSFKAWMSPHYFTVMNILNLGISVLSLYFIFSLKPIQ